MECWESTKLEIAIKASTKLSQFITLYNWEEHEPHNK